MANYRFAEVVFDQLSSKAVSRLALPSTALFALRLYLIQRPNDPDGLHTLSLLLEREKQYGAALELLHRLSEILEQLYEDSEEEDILSKFCIVKSDLGRIYLALGDYEAAVENSSTALDLLQDMAALDRVRLSSHLTQGLGYYFLGEMDDAIGVFQSALAESNEDVDVMLLVAQALWAVGGVREKEVAIEQIHDWFRP